MDLKYLGEPMSWDKFKSMVMEHHGHPGDCDWYGGHGGNDPPDAGPICWMSWKNNMW